MQHAALPARLRFMFAAAGFLLGVAGLFFADAAAPRSAGAGASSSAVDLNSPAQFSATLAPLPNTTGARSCLPLVSVGCFLISPELFAAAGRLPHDDAHCDAHKEQRPAASFCCCVVALHSVCLWAAHQKSTDRTTEVLSRDHRIFCIQALSLAALEHARSSTSPRTAAAPTGSTSLCRWTLTSRCGGRRCGQFFRGGATQPVAGGLRAATTSSARSPAFVAPSPSNNTRIITKMRPSFWSPNAPRRAL